MIFIFFTLLFQMNNAYNIVFLPDSFIEPKTYKPFINNIEDKLNYKNIMHKISFAEYLPLVDSKEETIIIGHSVGGFFGLLNCIKNKNNIKGCVLINSHFNQRYKMPYFAVPLKCVNQPVLTILTRDDDKLPLKKALDDYCITIEEKIKNKFFLINDGDHMSLFIKEEDINILSSQIVEFIEKITNQTFSSQDSI